MAKVGKQLAKRSKKSHRSRRQFKWSKQRIIYASISIFVVVVLAIAYAGSLASRSGRLVTFHDRGQDHVILTRATTVQDALNDADITVAPQDDVEPAVNSQLLSTDSAVIIYRARPVLVIDGALREKVLTPAQSPNEIVTAVGMTPLVAGDKTTLKEASVVADGASETLTIERSVPTPKVVAVDKPKPTALSLTKSKGAQIYVDSSGVAHRETYYDLPMNIVIGSCGPGGYTIRYDGAKVDKDGYILVAANYGAYPRCTVVETSMGLGKVYDTGGFATRYPHGFDLATDWTNYNGS